MKNAILGLALCASMPLFAQQKATVAIHPEQGKQVINKKSMVSLPNISELVYMVDYGLVKTLPSLISKDTVLTYSKH